MNVTVCRVPDNANRMWSNARTSVSDRSIVECTQRYSRSRTIFEHGESTIILWAFLVVLLLLWLVGFYGGFVTTSLIHLLLVAAVVVLALTMFKHRNPA
jgi:hypothetical protein